MPSADQNHRASPLRFRSSARRSGVAAVEFAVCLPLIILLVFGSIEASSFIFLKQSLSVAAYEGTREASATGATLHQAQERAESILKSRGVREYEIEFPKGVNEVGRGQQVICSVSAPTNPNSPLAGDFVSNRVLTSSVVMLKE